MPNFMDLISGRKNRTVWTRLDRLKREGSPYYTWAVPATAAAGVSVIHVPTQFPASRKYEPLDYAEIVNNEPANALSVAVNGTTLIVIVPAKTIRYIVGQAILHLAVTNNGGAITTLNNIIVSLRRQPLTTDRILRGDVP